MTLWFFQLAFNVLFLGVGLQFLRQRRRILSLEQRLAAAERGGQPALIAETAVAEEAAFKPLPLPSTQGSVLSEKTLKPSAKPERITRASVLEAYDKAELLLAQGVDVTEVARRTGLSVSELQLFGKVSQKNQ